MLYDALVFLVADWWHRLWPELASGALTGIVALLGAALLQLQVGNRLLARSNSLERERQLMIELHRKQDRARESVLVPLRLAVEGRSEASAGSILQHPDVPYIPKEILAATNEWRAAAQRGQQSWDNLERYVDLSLPTGAVTAQRRTVLAGLWGEENFQNGEFGGSDRAAAIARGFADHSSPFADDDYHREAPGAEDLPELSAAVVTEARRLALWARENSKVAAQRQEALALRISAALESGLHRKD